MTIAPISFQIERQRWTNHFHSQLPEQARKAIHHAHSESARPQALQKYFESYLTLMRLLRKKPEYIHLYLELLFALHPWPLRWGEWETWSSEICEALHFLPACEAGGRRARLQTDIAHIYFKGGRFAAAQSIAEEALHLAWVNKELITWAEAGSIIVQVLNRLGRTREARWKLNELESQLQTLKPDLSDSDQLPAAGHLLRQRMAFLRQDGHSLLASERAQDFISQLAPRVSADRHLLAGLNEDRATMLWASGNYTEAVNVLQEAIALYADMGDMYSETAARGNLGIVYWSMAALDKAEASICKTMQMAEEMNARWQLTIEMGNLCAVYLSRGKLIEAGKFTKQHLALARSVNDTAEINRALGNSVLVQLYSGDFASALPNLHKSLSQLEELGLREQTAGTYIDLSYCYYGLGQLRQAYDSLDQAERLSHQIDSPTLSMLIYRCRSLLVESAEAMNLLTRALHIAHHHQRRLDQAGCLLSLAGLTANQEHQQSYWEQGASLLCKIGAEAWLNNHSPENPPIVAMLL